ncbi:ribonuclease E inhibitor RraB [Asticcacaulis sp. DXS10W]|uniref:Ribonuclease E inhibitor RraB n=1 Tax=Asticcacaulis currens TaxID=2984210 RepID=A0ABT5I9V6_9CAUL|nr:ribonuclease E inhibitor RraB [Asticcacaulis currens]
MWETIWITAALIAGFLVVSWLIRWGTQFFGFNRVKTYSISIYNDDDYARSYSFWRDGFDLTKPQRLRFRYSFPSEEKAQTFLDSVKSQADLTLSLDADQTLWRVTITLLMMAERQSLRDARWRWDHDVQVNKGVYEGWDIND